MLFIFTVCLFLSDVPTRAGKLQDLSQLQLKQLVSNLSLEKTNNLGFQPGLSQTGLHSHRSRLELKISDLRGRRIALSV